MDYSSILEQAKHYVRSFFDTHVNSALFYHNYQHTEQVAAAAGRIAQHYQLNDSDFFVVSIAAWFHDIGYLTGEGPGHEERGAGLAQTFLEGKGVDKAVIESVRNCILATRLPQQPQNLLEQIVCDADLFHLGTDAFKDRNRLMRKEAEAVQHRKISKEEWRSGTIRFLQSHHYYTDYVRLLLNDKKQENINRQIEKEGEDMEDAVAKEGEVKDATRQAVEDRKGAGGEGQGNDGYGDVHGNDGHKKDGQGGDKHHGGGKGSDKQGSGPKGGYFNPIPGLLREHELEEGEERSADVKPTTGKEKKPKKKDPGRGIDTVFRITSNNNQRLSTQADSKAHILIQVNSIIISVLLSLLLRKIEDNLNLAIPTIILLAVNLITIILSILATRPHIPPGTFSKADLDDKKVNLLFFGNFYKMSLEEYAAGMLIMMDDKDFLYGSLIRDVYYQGIALGKKYRWLRLSYNVFMYGLILSVLAFVIAAIGYRPK